MKNTGYLLVDHRASPGLSENEAARFGYNPTLVKEGKVFEADTKTCSHCQTVVLLRLDRVRPRGHCFECNNYICDSCDAARHEPDYVHHTFADIVELALSGIKEKTNG